MKNVMLVVAAALLGLAQLASANSQGQPQAVTSVIGSASSSFTVVGINISSAPATSIVSISTLTIDLSGMYKQVCAQNLDTTNALYCGDTIFVSSQTTNAFFANYGVVVPPAGSAVYPAAPTCFSIVAGRDFYCRSGSVTGTTKAVVVRAR